jgi:hypothetical protein
VLIHISDAVPASTSTLVDGDGMIFVVSDRARAGVHVEDLAAVQHGPCRWFVTPLELTWRLGGSFVEVSRGHIAYVMGF